MMSASERPSACVISQSVRPCRRPGSVPSTAARASRSIP
jgi:hypothetical protein